MPSQRPLELRAIPALALLLIAISWVVANAGRGFGLTDESFYLWWSARPGDFAAMIQPFGPPLHLLFEAAGETVPGFRLAGLAFLLGAGAILGLALAGPVRAARPSIGTSTVVIVTMTAMLANYAQWVITPNYNQLTSIAAALCLAGLLWWAERRDKAILASALIGVSGALVLFAKPTAAVISALAALAILGWRMRAIGTATTIIRAAIAGLAALATLGAVLEATVGVGAFGTSNCSGNLASAPSVSTLQNPSRPSVTASPVPPGVQPRYYASSVGSLTDRRVSSHTWEPGQPSRLAMTGAIAQS